MASVLFRFCWTTYSRPVLFLPKSTSRCSWLSGAAPLRKGAAPDSQEHLDVLLGKNNTGREYVVQQNLNNTLAIVKGEWKYIEPSDGPAIEFWTKMELGNDKQPQLYDLSSDPSEKTNVAKSHPEIVKELSALLESVKEE